MCGILGQIDYQQEIDQLTFRSMLDTLSHRGPDGCKTVFLDKGRVALGHYRLSIIDLSEAGVQPMTNENETVWLVYNGEIYNFSSLRQTLIKAGHVFRSHTDSEVIIHAYEEWGDDCVHYLRGIFAFGLWDSTVRRLLLARDHLGVKPLYYSTNGHRFTFASQPRAIVQDPSVKRKIDVSAFTDYLAYGYVPFDKAIFQGMAKLPAAHRLIFEDDDLKVERYWKVQYTPLIDREPEAVHLLSKTLQETIQLQMISDVPVGAFLSGGIDSSGVTALMSAASNETLQTFTIGFEEENSDERDYARIAAKRFSTLHHENVFTEDIAFKLIPSFSEIYDEPFFDSSGLPTHFVSKLARSKDLKVILTGDGGDEVFAGYRWYDFFSDVMMSNRMEGFRKWIEHCRKKYLGGTQNHPANGVLEDYFKYVGFLSGEKQKDMLTASALDESETNDYLWLLRSFYRPGYPAITMAQHFDINTYLVDDILTKVDRASMACGLEVRVPLLDYKLVELAFTIDAGLLYHNNMRKYILKKTFAQWVPTEILTARKKGFSIPLHQWMKNYLQECTLNALGDGSLVNQGILSPSITQNSLITDNPQILWLLFAAELWARRWVEECSIKDIGKLFVRA